MKYSDLKNIVELKKIVDEGGRIKIKFESGKTFYMSNKDIGQASGEDARDTIIQACDILDGRVVK